MRACPKCGSDKAYRTARQSRLRCSACGRDFSETAGTSQHAHKKPAEWYALILELRGAGMSAHAIAKTGIGSAKAVFCFLKRWELENGQRT